MADRLAESASASTGSKSGFIGFGELCKGVVKKYSFNLVDLREKTTEVRIVDLIKKLEETIEFLERRSGRKVEYFCIGKTHVKKRKKRKFNPTNAATWKVDGIKNRWHGNYSIKGYDGLVVLGAVSRGMLNDKRKKNVWNQENYALALESALITYFAYEKCDPRLANGSLQTGKTGKTLYVGYVVYVAFKYQEETDEEGTDEEETDELN